MDNAILNIIDWLLGLIACISSLIVIYSGVKYILARGNKKKEIKAGKMFIYSLVILIISGFLYALSIPVTPVIIPS